MRERGLEPLWFNPLDPKGINQQISHCLPVLEITRNLIIIKSFPVSLMSAGVGANRLQSERHGHNMDITVLCKGYHCWLFVRTPMPIYVPMVYERYSRIIEGLTSAGMPGPRGGRGYRSCVGNK